MTWSHSEERCDAAASSEWLKTKDFKFYSLLSHVKRASSSPSSFAWMLTVVTSHPRASRMSGAPPTMHVIFTWKVKSNSRVEVLGIPQSPVVGVLKFHGEIQVPRVEHTLRVCTLWGNLSAVSATCWLTSLTVILHGELCKLFLTLGSISQFNLYQRQRKSLSYSLVFFLRFINFFN